jgi:sugar phosphate isomerase/epimerase
MNRLAIHESAAAGLSPTQLVDVAQQSGFASVGLKVAHSAGADRWWSKGAGSAELPSMVEHLLTRRVSVLDVGRIELGGEQDAESYRGVLDLAERFGARYVTAGGVPDGMRISPVADQFAALVADSDDYLLIPLLVAAPGTDVASTAQALDIVRRVGGGVVITASTAQAALEIEEQVLEAGNHLGYLRLLAEELDAAGDDDLAGLLATVPVHVPIAVGSQSPGAEPDADLAGRAARWAVLIDRMLEHPLARAARLEQEQVRPSTAP